jgi:glycosyltransferase involved in cell wall biosynthesis
MKIPKISVLMPVYNGEKYLKEAIESILNQTFNDFEFLIINDGSTDNSENIIKSYNDQRIKLIQNEKNIGLINTLNKGFDLCCGEYIARMDSDDISTPDRLEKQLKFLDQNKNTDICGSLIRTFGEVNSSIFRYPMRHDSIKATLLFKCSIAHPSVMLRKSAIQGFYFDSSYKHAEDYELWTRLSKNLKLFNIQEVLLLYRMHSDQVSQFFCEEQKISAKKIILNQFDNLDYRPQEDELELHQQIGSGNIIASKEFVDRAEKWLLKLKNLNSNKKYYLEPDFSYVIAEQWFLVCIKASKFGLWSFYKFFCSRLSRKNNLSFKSKWKLFIRCLKK